MNTTKLWLALALSLLVVSSRLRVVAKFGVQEPYMDSFSELEDYKAAQEGRFDKVLEHSISFHIEHRIFLTRWLNVGLFLANRGQWDLLLQACVNAVLAGFCVFVIVRNFGPPDGRLVEFLALTLAAVCFALPHSYENVLWGFQSQHFLFILFSLLTISLMIRSRPFAGAWWFGWASGALSCLSLGSGFFASLTVAATCALMASRKRYRRTPVWITLAGALFILICYLPTISRVHSPDEYRADSVRRFLGALLGNLAWPNLGSEYLWLSFLMWIPWVALLGAALFRRRTLPRISYGIIALGIWILLVTVTLAFLRGRASPYVRYFDYNAFNVVANVIALAELFRLRLYPRVAVGLKTGIVGAWFAMVLIGLSHLSQTALYRDLPYRRMELLNERRAINLFFQDNDPDLLKGPELQGVFPFREPYTPGLANELRDPEVQKFLPREMKTGDIEEKPTHPLSLFRRFILRHSARIWLFSALFTAVLLTKEVATEFDIRRLFSARWWRQAQP